MVAQLYIILIMKDVQQNPRILNEVCKKGNLEQYRQIVKELFDFINKHGCRIATQYHRPTSTLDWSPPTGPIIRLNPEVHSEPLHVIWILLHEFGHFLSGKPQTPHLNNQQRWERELLAWEHADQQLNKFPVLLPYMESYIHQRANCLKTYEDNLGI